MSNLTFLSAEENLKHALHSKQANLTYKEDYQKLFQAVNNTISSATSCGKCSCCLDIFEPIIEEKFTCNWRFLYDSAAILMIASNLREQGYKVNTTYVPHLIIRWGSFDNKFFDKENNEVIWEYI